MHRCRHKTNEYFLCTQKILNHCEKSQNHYHDLPSPIKTKIHTLGTDLVPTLPQRSGFLTTILLKEYHMFKPSTLEFFVLIFAQVIPCAPCHDVAFFNTVSYLAIRILPSAILNHVILLNKDSHAFSASRPSEDEFSPIEE